MSQTLPYQKHSATSKAAAAAFSAKAPTVRYRVWEYIRDNGPCSDLQVQDGLQMGGNTQRPRRIELESAGHVKPVGTVSDANGTGRVVYVATDKPYPTKTPKGYWDSSMRKIRANQPTADEFSAALSVIREARKVLPKELFTKDAMKAFKWLKKQT